MVVTGDDGLTLRFREALESALHAAHDFDYPAASDKEDIRLIIPTNLHWSSTSGGLIAHTVVVVKTRSDKSLGVIRRDCLETQMDRCASDVLERVRGLARASNNRWRGP